MKLFECSAMKIYDDFHKLIVAKDKEEAEKKFIEWLDGEWVTNIWIKELNEVDGYQIQAIKK